MSDYVFQKINDVPINTLVFVLDWHNANENSEVRDLGFLRVAFTDWFENDSDLIDFIANGSIG